MIRKAVRHFQKKHGKVNDGIVHYYHHDSYLAMLMTYKDQRYQFTGYRYIFDREKVSLNRRTIYRIVFVFMKSCYKNIIDYNFDGNHE
jgi:hypothetical protein